ncbi:hypothetical protein [Nonomuraea dietziae]|uniref:hypothetical protein n=1 Tax=Nonomuraea dietziae TaxID=65515 RepID=UPI0031D0B535
MSTAVQALLSERARPADVLDLTAVTFWTPSHRGPGRMRSAQQRVNETRGG